MSQTKAQNMARFREAVYSALWVELALVVCYVPIYVLGIVITHTKKIFITLGRHMGSSSYFTLL